MFEFLSLKTKPEIEAVFAKSLRSSSNSKNECDGMVHFSQCSTGVSPVPNTGETPVLHVPDGITLISGKPQQSVGCRNVAKPDRAAGIPHLIGRRPR